MSDTDHRIAPAEDLQPATEPVQIHGDVERMTIRREGRRIGTYIVRRDLEGMKDRTE